jgi:Organic Anion Transporter Polypeptide (OATP) family
VIFTTLTASYLGKSSHKTRWVAFGTVLVGLSCFVHMIPHWLYGPGENAMQLTHLFVNNGSSKESSAGLKRKHIFIKFTSLYNLAAEKIYLCGDKHSDAKDCEKSQTGNIATLIFLIARIMQGIGSSVYYTLGISYLDDNARKTKVPLLLGRKKLFLRL